MRTIDEFFRCFATSPRAAWEAAYERSGVLGGVVAVRSSLSASAPYSAWLEMRLCAGPPGTALPSITDARAALARGASATPADAYRVATANAALGGSLDQGELLSLLYSAVVASRREGADALTAWLSARAGFVALMFGEPSKAWSILDEAAQEGRATSDLERLAWFAPLREDESVCERPWVRAAIWWLWSRLDGPELAILPRLPREDLPSNERTLDETRAALRDLGACDVLALVEVAANALDLAWLEQCAEEPLIQELIARAGRGEAEAPDVTELPDYFVEWALAMSRSGAPEVSRLAGLVAWAVDPDDWGFAASLVLGAARASDLELVGKLLDVLPDERERLATLLEARENLPTELADTLVAFMLPGSCRRPRDFESTAARADELAAQDEPRREAIELVAELFWSNVEDERAAREAAAPELDRLVAAARRELDELTCGLRRLRVSDVQGVAERLTLEDVSLDLLVSAVSYVAALEPLERVVVSLALRRYSRSSPEVARVDLSLAHVAADAIEGVGEELLYSLRLELLDELVAATPAREYDGSLVCERAATRAVLFADDDVELDRVELNLELVGRRAMVFEQHELVASVALVWADVRLRRYEHDVERSFDWLDDALTVLAEAQIPHLSAATLAKLQRAEAQIQERLTGRKNAPTFVDALRALAPSDPIWPRLATELVGLHRRTRRDEETAELGRELLDRAAACVQSRSAVGALYVEMGAFYQSLELGRNARTSLETGLELLRGRDPRREASARLLLIKAGLEVEDAELVETHLDFLTEHSADLLPTDREKLAHLSARVAPRMLH